MRLRRFRALVAYRAAELIVLACALTLLVMHMVTKQWPPL